MDLLLIKLFSVPCTGIPILFDIIVQPDEETEPVVSSVSIPDILLVTGIVLLAAMLVLLLIRYLIHRKQRER